MRTLLRVLLIGTLAVATLACERRDSKVPLISFLQFMETPSTQRAREGLVEHLETSGMVQGVDFETEVRSANGDLSTLRIMAEKIRDSGAKVVVPLSGAALRAANDSIKNKPIVFVLVDDPMDAGVVEPDGDKRPNVTGVTRDYAFGRIFDYAQRILPNAKVYGTLYDPSDPSSDRLLQACRVRARQKGLDWQEVPVNGAGETASATNALMTRGVDLIIQVPSDFATAGFDGMLRVANRNRVPIMASQVSLAERGAVLAVGIESTAYGRQAGRLVERILSGEDPANLPIETPTAKPEFLLNFGAAQRLGVQVPSSIVDETDRTISF